MKKLRIGNVLFLCLVVFSLAACSSTPSIDIDDQSTQVSTREDIIRIVQSDGISFYQVKLSEEEGSTIISGKIKINGSRRNLRGHIDADIQNASGRTIHSASSTIDRHLSHPRHRLRHPSFRIVLSQTVPTGSKVQLSYHRNSITRLGSSTCENRHC